MDPSPGSSTIFFADEPLLRAMRFEAAIVHGKYQSIEQLLVSSVEWNVDEYTKIVGAHRGYAFRPLFLPEDLAPLVPCEFESRLEAELPKCPKYRSMIDDRDDKDVCFDPELLRRPLRAVFREATDFAAAAALRA